MKVRELIGLLENAPSDLDIRIDNDDNGFYELETIEVKKDLCDEENSFVNLVSSNEA